MKFKLLQQLKLLSKLALQIIAIQVSTISLLFATDMNAQKYKSVRDIDIVISVENDQIEDLFKEIERQTIFKFSYDKSHVKRKNDITIATGKRSIADVLLDISEQSSLRFTRVNDVITVSKKIRNEKATPLAIVENIPVSVSGKITDETGEELPGVSIIIKGTSKGTTSDIDGNYKLEVETGNTLSFSYIGYTTQDIVISSQTVIDVVLLEDISTLSEVVVIGYQSQDRKAVTSAISSVGSKEILKANVGNVSFDRSLAGLMKGVNVTSNSGATTATVNINIRGYTSPFSGSNDNPLFVIDGVPFHVAPLSTHEDGIRESNISSINPLLAINPNEIESIDVLKDAAATAVYGSRGANGVIIVTTKKGKRNMKPTVSWNSTMTMAKPILSDDLLNAAEWKEHVGGYLKNTADAYVRGELGVQRRGNPVEHPSLVDLVIFDAPGGNFVSLNNEGFGDEDIDYADFLFKNPAITKVHNFSIRGGGENTSYSVNLGYTDKEGLTLADEIKIYSLRLSLDTKLSSMFETGVNLSLSHSKTGLGNNGSIGYNYQDLKLRPDLPIYDSDGNPILFESGFFGVRPVVKPTVYATMTQANNDADGYNAVGNTFLRMNINENLSVKLDLSGGLFTTSQYRFAPATILGFEIPSAPWFGERTPEFSTANFQQSINKTLTTDLVANYSRTFDKHTMTALVGYSWLRSSSYRMYNTYLGFPDDKVLIDISNSTDATFSSASLIESGLNSFIGQLTYNYDSKYFVTATGRTDKSSKFGPGNKTGFFPSISASWNITKEDFLTELGSLSLLRLRVGTGVTGTTNVGDFAFLQGFESTSDNTGVYAGLPAVGLVKKLANEDLAWEETTDVNAGLDFALLNNRIRGSIDVYNKKTEGSLTTTPIPLESGLTDFTSNFIDLTNKGFEFELMGDVIVTDDFKWALGVNISQNKNTVDNITATIENEPRSIYIKGQSINVVRGYIVEGIFQTQEEIDVLNTASPTGNYMGVTTANRAYPGDYKFKDVSGPDGVPDGLIDIEDSYNAIGNGNPDFYGGLSSSMSYKGFELSALFNFVIGGEVVYNDYFLNPVFLNNVPERYSTANRWSPTNKGAEFPRLVRGSINGVTSDRDLYDKSYFRLRNIQLTYNLPENTISKLGLSAASVFISASNVFTWTKYPGADPENGVTATAANFSPLTRNQQSSGASYPNAKSWSLGINLKF